MCSKITCFLFSVKKDDDDAIEVVSNEEIYTALLTPEDHYQELNPNPAGGMADPIPIPETLPEKTEQMTSLSLPSLASSSSTRNYLTMTGTYNDWSARLCDSRQGYARQLETHHR